MFSISSTFYLLNRDQTPNLENRVVYCLISTPFALDFRLHMDLQTEKVQRANQETFDTLSSFPKGPGTQIIGF